MQGIKEAIEKLLADPNITNYQISKATGISQVSLNKFSKGESSIDNMPLGNALKLYDYYLKHKEGIKLSNDKRDELFGRMLSVCAILGERVFEEGKPSVDEITFKKYPKAPATTFEKMHKNILQYSHKFGPEENEILQVLDGIFTDFDILDFKDVPLTEKYLLGYYKQNHELKKYRNI